MLNWLRWQSRPGWANLLILPLLAVLLIVGGYVVFVRSKVGLTS